MQKPTTIIFVVAMIILQLDAHAWGQLSERLLITEVMWKSKNPVPNDFGVGGYADGDWWELLNASDQPIDLSGWLWDDDNRLQGNDFTRLPPFVIQPSELIIVLEESEENEVYIDGFRAAWGLPQEMRILNRSVVKGSDEVTFRNSLKTLRQRSLADINLSLDQLGLSAEERQVADMLVQEAFNWSEADLTNVIASQRNKIDELINLKLAGHDYGFDTFSGISSGGDEVNLYDADDKLVQMVTLGAATPGFSTAFGFVEGKYAALGLSQNGQNEAFMAKSDGSGRRFKRDENNMPLLDDNGNPIIDPEYIPPSLDVGSPGKVVGFQVVFPGSAGMDLNQICSQVASGNASISQLNSTLKTLGSLPGDTNLNGSVDFSDFLALSSNFGKSVPGGAYSLGDVNCTGEIDFSDFLILSSNFGKSSGANAVPEPQLGVSVLLSSWLAYVSRRRNRRLSRAGRCLALAGPEPRKQ